MDYNLAELIERAIDMSNELDLLLSFHYSKESIRFMFMKNDMSIGWDFTMMEIENISDINILKKILTDRVYKLLDAISNNQGE